MVRQKRDKHPVPQNLTRKLPVVRIPKKIKSIPPPDDVNLQPAEEIQSQRVVIGVPRINGNTRDLGDNNNVHRPGENQLQGVPEVGLVPRIGGQIRAVRHHGLRAAIPNPPNAIGLSSTDINVNNIGPIRLPKPGDAALREIKRYQNSTECLIPKMTLSRLIKEVAQKFYDKIRFQASALEAIQVAAEDYLVSVFEEANICAGHANRVTVKPEDMRLALRVRGDGVGVDQGRYF